MKHRRLRRATLLTGALATAGGVNHPTSAGPLGQDPCTAITSCSCSSHAFVITPRSATPTASFWRRSTSKTIKTAYSLQSHNHSCPKRSWAAVSAASASDVSAMTASRSSAAYPARTPGRQSRTVQQRGWGVVPAVSRGKRVPGTFSAAGENDDSASCSGATGEVGGVGMSDAERAGDGMDASGVGEKEEQEDRWIRRLDVAVRVTCCVFPVTLPCTLDDIFHSQEVSYAQY